MIWSMTWHTVIERYWLLGIHLKMESTNYISHIGEILEARILLQIIKPIQSERKTYIEAMGHDVLSLEDQYFK